MKTKRKHRTSYLATPWLPLKVIAPLHIYGHGKSGEFVCRLEINASGVKVVAGVRGRRNLGKYSWEDLVSALE